MPRTIFSGKQERLQVLLRETRQDAGLGQVALAKKLGRPQSFVSKYENGERRLDIIELQEICAELGVSLSAFARRLEKIIAD